MELSDKNAHAQISFRACAQNLDLRMTSYISQKIYMTHGQEGMEVQINGMDRWMSLQQGLPILYGVEWNGQMEHPGLAASHTLEIRPTPKWTDGCLSSRDFPYSTSPLYGMDRWNILGWQLPILQS